MGAEMNFTVTAEQAIRAEKSCFHTQPFQVAVGSNRAPMLVALWSCDGEGRLAQTWVSVSMAGIKNEADAYRPVP
jgi:hypothetical protein